MKRIISIFILLVFSTLLVGCMNVEDIFRTQNEQPLPERQVEIAWQDVPNQQETVESNDNYNSDQEDTQSDGNSNQNSDDYNSYDSGDSGVDDLFADTDISPPVMPN